MLQQEAVLSKEGLAVGAIIASIFSELCLCYFEDSRILSLLMEYKILGYFRCLDDIITFYNRSLIGTDDMLSEFASNYGRLTFTLEHCYASYRTNNLENSTSPIHISLE
jgi:hypothetical protein